VPIFHYMRLEKGVVVSNAIVLATEDGMQVPDDGKVSSQENSFTPVLRISKVEVCIECDKKPSGFRHWSRGDT
jgi:hypothetical protein